MSDFVEVTEAPGTGVTREAVRMLQTRYAYAAQFCSGKDALEIGCGPGIGLGLLKAHARTLVGGDYSQSLLSSAQGHYGGQIPLVRFDAHSLPFGQASFDAVVLFEAIYYLERPEQFLEECRKVLRPQGIVLMCLANKEWTGFHRSPHSHRYYSASELGALFRSGGFEPQIFGAFPDSVTTAKSKMVAFVRRSASALNLIPKTMKGKELLKRLFYGQLSILGHEIEGTNAAPEPLFELSPNGACPQYKILYAIAHLRAEGINQAISSALVATAGAD